MSIAKEREIKLGAATYQIKRSFVGTKRIDELLLEKLLDQRESARHITDSQSTGHYRDADMRNS